MSETTKQAGQRVPIHEILRQTVEKNGWLNKDGTYNLEAIRAWKKANPRPAPRYSDKGSGH